MTIQRLLPIGLALLLGTALLQSAPAATQGADPRVTAAPPAPPPPSAAVLDLRREIDRVIRAPGWSDAVHSVLVVSLDRGDTIYALNPDLPVAPASNMKLFSTAAALYYLGPDFHYSTFALADGPIANGVLDGDLILYGTGDPAMSSRMLSGSLTPLRALADSLLAQGVNVVRGDVVGDGSYFDDVGIGEGWREEYRLASYSAPVGALSLGENIVSIRVLPGEAGGPAEIRTTPSTAGLLVNNEVRTVAGGRSSVRFSYDPSGLVIRGQIARGHPGVARTVTVVDPANYAAAAFRAVLADAGIEVQGGVRTVGAADQSVVGRPGLSANGGANPPRVLGVHASPPLREIVAVTNQVSQNLYAEALFKTVGRVAIGEGSFSAGALAVQYFLECEEPVDLHGVRLVDGSGLSPLSRVTARATIHLLDLVRESEVWDDFYASLPEAASPTPRQHSLRTRMGGTPAALNVRAKTGTISNVSSLSGYARAANGELLAFSIYANEVPSTWRAKRIEDDIAVRLAGFDRPVPQDEESGGPPPAPSDALTPAPARPEEVPEAAPEAEPEPEPRFHSIGSGDTLDGIARRYGTTVAELRRLNPGVDPRRLQLGQSIRIPD